MAKDHNVEIDDDNANWLEWGKLLWKWIQDPTLRPLKAGDFQKALDNNIPPIKGTIKGAITNPNRPVEWRVYDGAGPIIIPIPKPNMVQKDWDHLADEFNNGRKKYPSPKFYRLIYEGTPPKRDFGSAGEMQDMALRRLGEYVINECM